VLRRILFGLTLLGAASVVIVAIAIGAVLFSGAGRIHAQQQPRNPITYGLTLMPTTFDPYVGSSSELGIALRSVYDTLIYRDPTTRGYVPGLAERTEATPDGLTYTFYLRHGVTFHDGSAFDATAVARTLDRVIDPKTGSQKALYLLGPYDHYTIVDTYTIQIVLKRPYAPLLDGLAQVYLGISSPKALADYGPDLYQFHQVGTGPFELLEYIPGDHLTLVRNPAYTWGPSFYHIPTANVVDAITFRFYTDAPTRAPALESGEAQIMGELSPIDAVALAASTSAKIYTQALPGLPLQFLLNTAHAPTDQLAVRQGLIQATNRAAIVQAVFQQFSPVAYGPLTAVTPYYTNAVQAQYPFDTTGALKLFSKAGYVPSADNKLLVNKGTPLNLTMIVPPWGFTPEVAQQIQSQWRELGITLTLRQVPNRAGLLAEQQKGDYNLIAINDFGVDASVLNRYYLGDAVPSWSHYSDKALDTLLGSADNTLDPAIRGTLYAQAQQAIMAQALVLPIRDYVNLNGAVAGISGLSFDAYGWFPLLANLGYESNVKATSTPFG